MVQSRRAPSSRIRVRASPYDSPDRKPVIKTEPAHPDLCKSEPTPEHDLVRPGHVRVRPKLYVPLGNPRTYAEGERNELYLETRTRETLARYATADGSLSDQVVFAEDIDFLTRLGQWYIRFIQNNRRARMMYAQLSDIMDQLPESFRGLPTSPDIPALQPPYAIKWE
ncbi:hypothetical protein HDU78_000771 [Chytriomyces hyalinus]|nr:hypothetical protein HDU78_000771 [Chytriomyces hyalinus]